MVICCGELRRKNNPAPNTLMSYDFLITPGNITDVTQHTVSTNRLKYSVIHLSFCFMENWEKLNF